MAIGIDIETNDMLSPYDKGAEIVSVSLYGERLDFVGLWNDEVADYIKKLDSSGVEWVAHNAKFEKTWLQYHGVTLTNCHCTMLMHYLLTLDTELHSLEYCSQFTSVRKLKKPDTSNTEALLKYNRVDSIIASELFDIFRERLESAGIWDYYLEIELPYIDILVEMGEGVHIDMEYFQIYKERTEKEHHALWCELVKQAPVIDKKVIEYKDIVLLHRVKTPDGDVAKFTTTGIDRKTKVRQWSHCTFDYWNPGSPDQKIKVLKAQGWVPEQFTKTGKPCTDKHVLADLDLPIAKALRAYNSVDSTLSATLHPIEERVDENNILRGQMNQCVTATLRLSSSQPNLQNIPARGEKGADIRRMFTARPGHVLAVGDLDRIEVCVLAFYLEVMFGDTNYSDAIRSGEDVHQINADTWGIDRSPAKNGLFSWIYGAQLEKFAQTTGLSLAQAKRVFQRMEENNPALFMYREACERTALENNGRLVNFMGGMHYIPDIMSQERWIQASGKRKASNYAIQGTAASLFKYLQVQESVRTLCKEVGARIVLAVHDEAIYEVPTHFGEYFAEKMTSYYSTNDLLRDGEIYVPVSATFHVGHNWLEAKNG